MKITKKLLAVCVAALALSMALMGCNGGSSAKPAGSDAGSAPKQATEKKESKKPADDRIDFTWFKAYAPEGYDVWARSGSDGNVSEILFNGIEDSNKVISFGVSSTRRQRRSEPHLSVTYPPRSSCFTALLVVCFGCDRELASSFCWHVPLFSLRKYSIHIALSDSPKLLAAAEYISFCSFHRLLYAAIAHSVLLCGWFSIFSLFFNSSLLLVSPNPDVSQINFIIIIRIRTFVKRKKYFIRLRILKHK